MEFTRRRLLAVVAAGSLPLAGCSGDGGGGQADDTTRQTTTRQTAAQATTTRTTTTTTAADETTTTATETTAETTTTTETTTRTTTATETTTRTTTTATPTPTTTPEPDKTIDMVDISFKPVKAEVAVGATVEWVNKDGFQHDVTSAQFSSGAASWDFSETLGANEAATFTFESAGVYEYYCTIHGSGTMCGVVLVGDVTYDGSLPCQDDGGGGGNGGGGY